MHVKQTDAELIKLVVTIELMDTFNDLDSDNNLYSPET